MDLRGAIFFERENAIKLFFMVRMSSHFQLNADIVLKRGTYPITIIFSAVYSSK